MGQKVNPHGLRVGVIKNWDSRWYARKDVFGDTLVEDYNLRKDLKKQLAAAGVPAELVRMSCGLESSEDLIADIAQALDKI